MTTTRTAAVRISRNVSARDRRRVLATILALAADLGHSDGLTYADCVACGNRAYRGLGNSDPNRFELGHVVSDFHGGKYRVDNLLPMCRACNVAQGEAHLFDVMTPRYDTRIHWSGRLLPDPGSEALSPTKDTLTRVWLPPAE